MATPLTGTDVCPRCGHTVSVQVAQARASGAIDLTCVECGLHMRLDELTPELVSSRWYVESPQSAFRLPRRVLGTLLRACVPHRFWSSIPIALPLRRAPLLAFLVGVVAALYVVAATSRTIEYFQRRPNTRLAPAGPAAPWTSADTAGVAFAIAAPWSGHRGESIWNAGSVERGGPEAYLDNLAAILGEMVRVGFDPRALEDRVRLQNPRWGLSPDPFPLIAQNSARTVWSAVGVAAFSPLALLLLPTSLRRARIQPRHFVRVTALSVVLAVPIAICTVALNRGGASWHFVDFSPMASVRGSAALNWVNAHAVLLYSTAAVVFVWVHAVASRYLRLAHPCGVAMSIAVLTTLVAWTISALPHLTNSWR